MCRRRQIRWPHIDGLPNQPPGASRYRRDARCTVTHRLMGPQVSFPGDRDISLLLLGKSVVFPLSFFGVCCCRSTTPRSCSSKTRSPFSIYFDNQTMWSHARRENWLCLVTREVSAVVNAPAYCCFAPWKNACTNGTARRQNRLYKTHQPTHRTRFEVPRQPLVEPEIQHQWTVAVPHRRADPLRSPGSPTKVL